jgi:hypothetical protein
MLHTDLSNDSTTQATKHQHRASAKKQPSQPLRSMQQQSHRGDSVGSRSRPPRSKVPQQKRCSSTATKQPRWGCDTIRPHTLWKHIRGMHQAHAASTQLASLHHDMLHDIFVTVTCRWLLKQPNLRLAPSCPSNATRSLAMHKSPNQQTDTTVQLRQASRPNRVYPLTITKSLIKQNHQHVASKYVTS